jgi:hypothetical protein
MAETLKIWFDASCGLSDQQIKEFLKTKNEDGDFAYFRETKAKNASVLVLQDGATPPIVFNAKTQSAVYKLWVEHVILETAPIPISRRYQAAYASQVPHGRPVQAPALSAAMLIESESESSSSESEMVVKEKQKKKKVTKAATVVGVKRDPLSSAEAEVAVKPEASSSNGRSPHEASPISTATKSAKRAQKASSEMDIDTPVKAKREKKIVAPRSVEVVGAKKRARVDEEDDFGTLAPKAKTPKRAVRSTSTKTQYHDESEGDERVDTSKKRARSQSLPHSHAAPNCPRVYLSQAPATDKQYHKRALGHLMTFVAEVSLATHVVSFSNALETDAPIPFSIVYAIGTSRWVLDRSWLIEAEAIGAIPAPENFEVRALPGTRLIRRAQAARKAYLEANGVLERNADEELDPHLPKLIFSAWTFYLEPLRKHYAFTTFKQIQEIISKNGGLIGGEENSDIWITKDGSEPVLAVYFGDPAPPSPTELARRQNNPHLNKRYFSEPSILRQMPTYAIPFDFIRTSIASGKCDDPTLYQNLIQYSRAL